MNLKVVRVFVLLLPVSAVRKLIYAPKKALVSMKPGSMPSVRKKDALSPEQAVSSHVPGCDAWCGTVAEASVSGKMSQ